MPNETSSSLLRTPTGPADSQDLDARMRAMDPQVAERAREIASRHNVPAVAVFVCGRRRQRHPCASCGGATVALCAFPLTGKAAGRTCDRPMCERCRRPQPGQNIDYCGVHAAMVEDRATGRST